MVEDSEPVRRMIKSFVGDLADGFVECEDGCDALEAYAEHRPDLVLMDIEMSRLGGLEATAEIKAAFPEARVVIVSQWDSPALRQAARLGGAESFISKTD